MAGHTSDNGAASTLWLSQRTNRCTALGPGLRAVLWVQGCPFRCPHCVALETLPFRGGTATNVEELANELIDVPDIEGLTFSGGEPMSQAAALSALIDRIRPRRELTWMSYTGFTLRQLQERGTAAQTSLLQRLDILVDGLYERRRHTDLIWRGSENQVVHLLSDRYRHLRGVLEQRANRIEFEIDGDGFLQWMGIPPLGFREEFENGMLQRGMPIQPTFPYAASDHEQYVD